MTAAAPLAAGLESWPGRQSVMVALATPVIMITVVEADTLADAVQLVADSGVSRAGVGASLLAGDASVRDHLPGVRVVAKRSTSAAAVDRLRGLLDTGRLDLDARSPLLELQMRQAIDQGWPRPRADAAKAALWSAELAGAGEPPRIF